MRCLPGLRIALTLGAMIPMGVCMAQMPETLDDQKELHPSAPSRQSDDHPSGTPALDEVHLNIVDQKLALSLAVDTWGQIAAGEAALPSIKQARLKEILTARLEKQRQFLAQLETLTGGRCLDAIQQACDEIERDSKVEQTRAVRFRPLALNRQATAMIVRIRVEILQQYTDSVNQQLAAHDGEQFDQQFLRTDLLHQMQMLAMLHVFAGQASADFAEVIQAAAGWSAESLNDSRQALAQMEAPPAFVVQPAVVPLAGAATAQ